MIKRAEASHAESRSIRVRDLTTPSAISEWFVRPILTYVRLRHSFLSSLLPNLRRIMSTMTAATQIAFDDFRQRQQGMKFYPHPHPTYHVLAGIDHYSNFPHFVDQHGSAYSYLDHPNTSVLVEPYITGSQLGLYDTVPLAPPCNALLYHTDYPTAKNFTEPVPLLAPQPFQPLPAALFSRSSATFQATPSAGTKGSQISEARDASQPVPVPPAPWMLSGSLDLITGTYQRSDEHPRLRTAQACEKCRTRKAKVHFHFTSLRF